MIDDLTGASVKVAGLGDDSLPHIELIESLVCTATDIEREEDR
jgi:hypothetical protein